MLAARTPPQGPALPASSRAEAARRGARHPQRPRPPPRSPDSCASRAPGQHSGPSPPRIAHSFPCHEPRGNEHLRPLIFFFHRITSLGKSLIYSLVHTASCRPGAEGSWGAGPARGRRDGLSVGTGRGAGPAGFGTKISTRSLQSTNADPQSVK